MIIFQKKKKKEIIAFPPLKQIVLLRNPQMAEFPADPITSKAKHQLTELFQEDSRLTVIQRLNDPFQHALPQPVSLEEHSRELRRYLGSHWNLSSLNKLARRTLKKPLLQIPIHLSDLRRSPPHPALHFLHFLSQRLAVILT